MIHQLFAVVFGLNNNAEDTAGQLYSFAPLWIPREGILFEFNDDCVARGMSRADYIAGNKDQPISRKEDMTSFTRRRTSQAGGIFETYRTLIYPKQRNIAIAYFGPNTPKNRARRWDFVEQISGNAKAARCNSGQPAHCNSGQPAHCNSGQPAHCMLCDERAIPALTGSERLYLISPARTALVNEQYLKLVKRLGATAKEQQFAVGVVRKSAFDAVPGHEKLPVLRLDGTGETAGNLPAETAGNLPAETAGNLPAEYTHLAECINLLYQTDGSPQWVYLPTLPETVPLEVVAQMQRGHTAPMKEKNNHAIP